MPLKEVTLKLVSIKEEYAGISERLQKLEERKSSVSEKIFAKVKGEYEQKHSELLKEIRPTLLRARQIINELKESVEAKKAQKKEFSESLEEFELRFALGEFDQAEFESNTDKIKQDIAELDSVILGVDESIQSVENHLEWFASHLIKKTGSPHSVETGSAVESAAAPESGHEQDERINTIHEDETIEDFPVLEDELDIDEAALLAGVETIDESSLLESFSNPGITFSDQPEIAVKTSPEVSGRTSDDPEAAVSVPQDSSPRRKEAVLEKIKNSRVEKIVPLNPGETAVGRGNNNDLVLLDRTVSREHALISLEPDGYILTDLNSTRGTFINGMRSDSKLLEEGDEIIIGSMVFRFKYI